MADINERSIARYLQNPFSVYIADTTNDQPATPAFYTEPAITVTPTAEFDEALAYGTCSENKSVQMLVRKDMKSFRFSVSYQVKETTITTLQLGFGGSKDSGGNTLRFDGTQPPLKAWWLESCYESEKAIRITIPQGRASEFSEIATGDGYVMIPHMIEAIVDPADSTTFVTIYVEA